MLTYRSKFFGGGTSGGSGPITVTGPIQATTVRAVAPATVTITGATNATPIVVTAVAHGLVTGDAISISGITGNTNANGYFKITRLTADTFSLQNYSTGADIAGNGAYGGTPVAVTGIVQSNRVLVGDGTAAAPSLSFANFPSTGFVVTSGPVVNAYANGTVTFSTRATQSSIWGNRIELGGGPNVVFDVTTAATLQLGGANAASPVAQTLQVQSARGGTDTNVAGPAWTQQGAIQTGNAVSGPININGGALSATSGTTAATSVIRRGTNWTKVLTNNSAIPVVNVTNASNTVAAGLVGYAVEVFNGTNLQVEVGEVSVMVTNKGGVWSGNTATKHGNIQNMSSGTLTVTWAITGANPAVLSVNANSSLTPSTGYPRITYFYENLTQQAVAMQ